VPAVSHWLNPLLKDKLITMSHINIENLFILMIDKLMLFSKVNLKL